MMIVLFGAKIFKQNEKGKNGNKIHQRKKKTIIYKKERKYIVASKRTERRLFCGRSEVVLGLFSEVRQVIYIEKLTALKCVHGELELVHAGAEERAFSK